MKGWQGFSGVLGVIAMVFGFFAWFAVGDVTSPFVAIHLVLGISCLVGWLIMVGFRDSERTSAALTGRTARFGANVVVYGAVVVALLGVVNWFAHRHDRRWDLTEEGAYSLSDQSQKLIAGLPKPLKIAAVPSQPTTDPLQGKELLEQYQAVNSSKVSVDFFDPRVKPHLVDAYGFKAGNLVYIEYGEGEAKAVTRINEFKEEAITNAILKLSRGAAKQVYIVQGHDEPDLKSPQPTGLKAFADSLEDEHVNVSELVLAQKKEVPEDAAAVFLISPKRPLLEQERTALEKYVDGGGRLLMMSDPQGGSDVTELAAKYGIDVGNDVIVDQTASLFGSPVQPVITSYGAHPMVAKMSTRQMTVFSMAQSVRSGKQIEGATVTEIFKTGPTAWAERNLEQLFDQNQGTATLEPDDLAGPVPMAAAYEKNLAAAVGADGKPATDEANASVMKTARVVVFGDSDWVTNGMLRAAANRDLLLNSINWLVGEEGGMVIRPRKLRSSSQPIVSHSFVLIVMSSFLIPELILIGGLMVWWRRRTVMA